MEEYSPIKIDEKSPPPYSVLKPDTNSDSPSEKSKGERLHSARQAKTQQKNNKKHNPKKENLTKKDRKKLHLSQKYKKTNKPNIRITS